MAYLEPEWVAQFAPESMAHFGPEWVAQFGPEYAITGANRLENGKSLFFYLFIGGCFFGHARAS